MTHQAIHLLAAAKHRLAGNWIQGDLNTLTEAQRLGDELDMTDITGCGVCLVGSVLILYDYGVPDPDGVPYSNEAYSTALRLLERTITAVFPERTARPTQGVLADFNDHEHTTEFDVLMVFDAAIWLGKGTL